MKYNISDIIDFQAVTAFQYFSLVTFIITVIVEIFYGIIVFLTTTKKMQFFRILTFIYIFECIFVEFSGLCWKPVRLFPYTVFYPTGILAPMSSTLSAILASFLPFGHALFIETFTIIVVERHFRILGHTTTIKNARFWVYFFMAITFCFAAIPYFMFTLQSIDDGKIQNLLEAEVQNVHLILDLQPSLYFIDYSLSLRLWIMAFFGGIYGLYRLALFTIVLKENYKFVQNNGKNISEKTRKQFSLMFHSTITQCLTTIFFGTFAGTWAITFFIGENTTGIKYVYYLSFCMMICYPIADVIVVIIVVKGYRNTLKKIFKLIKGKTNERISSFGLRNITIYNKNLRNHSIAAVATTTQRKSIFVY